MLLKIIALDARKWLRGGWGGERSAGSGKISDLHIAATSQILIRTML